VVGNWIRGRWGAHGNLSSDQSVRTAPLFLELGTVRSKPFPFLRPAADAVYGGLMDRLNPLL
jgi:hypothetical protein